jgi:hypothetical protein
MKTAVINFDLWDVIENGKIYELEEWIKENEKYKTEGDKYLCTHPSTGTYIECTLSFIFDQEWRKKNGISNDLTTASMLTMGSTHENIICFLVKHGLNYCKTHHLANKALEKMSYIVYTQNEKIKELENELKSVKSELEYVKLYTEENKKEDEVYAEGFNKKFIDCPKSAYDIFLKDNIKSAQKENPSLNTIEIRSKLLDMWENELLKEEKDKYTLEYENLKMTMKKNNFDVNETDFKELNNILKYKDIEILKNKYYDKYGYSHIIFSLESFDNLCGILYKNGYKYLENKYKNDKTKDEDDISKELYDLDIINRFMCDENCKTNKIILMSYPEEDWSGLDPCIMWRFQYKDIPEIIKELKEIGF